MISVVLALVAGLGAYLVISARAADRRAAAPATEVGFRPTARPTQRVREWLVQAGLADVSIGEFAGVMAIFSIVGAAAAYAVFGGILPAVVSALFAAALPWASYRTRRAALRAQALESWPTLLEELRILTSSLGRSIPQALFDVGRRAPTELRPAFQAAHREWLLSTDFDRTLAILKALLADATADAACETLLVAYEVGGTDVGRRLEALIDDRRQDVQGRKDARARQAGARFARKFVLAVPLGMALAGLSIGNGRAAYETSFGQLAVVVGLATMVVCWVWAGRIMRIPDERRVFHG